MAPFLRPDFFPYICIPYGICFCIPDTMTEKGYINSAAGMIAAIREIGIVPLFKSPVSGWSIEELTHPDWWFYTSDKLGPWDWKIDAVHEGIIYGKYISRRATFATGNMYRHLMNWRRSLPMYKVAEGRHSKCTTIDQRLQKYISPLALSAIRDNESLESCELRAILNESVPVELRKKVGGHIEKYLLPKVTKEAVDFILGFLDMGTWTVIGDITRVYRGPNCEYKGWQRNTVTTPDALFRSVDPSPERALDEPFWARFLDDECGKEGERSCERGGVREGEGVEDCSPEESRQIIIEHLTGLFPGNRDKFEKLI